MDTTQPPVRPVPSGPPAVAPGFVGFRDLDELDRAWERRERAAVAGGDRRGRSHRPEPVDDTRELCHDLRQPLAAAAALAAALEVALEDLPARVHEQVSLLRSQLEQASGIVAGGLIAPEPQVVSLAALARQACASLEATGSGPVDLVVLATPVVAGDPVQLLRLFGNLLSNARCAAGPGGRVRLVLSVRTAQAVVEVDDDGGAAGAPSVPTEVSSGLGLLIVAGIVSRHSGELSTAPGDLGGLRVRVALPVVLAVQAQGTSR